jgi:Tat protein translocase TatB subunit
MFGMSFGEIVVVLVLALVVVGPQKLPTVARSLGKAYAWMRHHLAVMQREINLEMRRIEMQEREKPAGPNKTTETTEELVPPPGPAYDTDDTDEPEEPAPFEPAPTLETTTTGNARLNEQRRREARSEEPPTGPGDHVEIEGQEPDA